MKGGKVMNASAYSEHHTPDDRRQSADSVRPFRRRLEDTFFNKVRWPVFVFLWFVGGLSLLLYLLVRIFG